MFDLIPYRRGMQNSVPSFITQYDPIREVRFIRKPDHTPDGGVHQLFTIVGRIDDPTIPDCTADVLPQPDFETEVRKGNLAFRIPLQMFGLGARRSRSSEADEASAIDILGAPGRAMLWGVGVRVALSKNGYGQGALP